jgi:hypothetical protein
VVHVEEVGVAQALDILGQGDRLLNVSVLLLVVTPDGVVYQHAIYSIIVIGGYHGLFKGFLIDLAEVEVKPAKPR